MVLLILVTTLGILSVHWASVLLVLSIVGAAIGAVWVHLAQNLKKHLR